MNGAAGMNAFAAAMRELKNEIPELAEELANLDAKSRIDATYKAALANATSGREATGAGILRDQAIGALRSKDAREAADRGMLDLIGYAEGTDKGRGYNETLSYGAYSGGDRNLTEMTLTEVLGMQRQMLAHPDNKFNSSAAGRYQIVSKTLRGLIDEMGLTGGERFDPEMQDRMAMQLLRRRGNNVAGLRHEWEGLRRIDSDLISRAYDGASVSMPAVDPGIADNRAKIEDQQKAAIEKARASDADSRQARMDGNAEAARAYSQNLKDQAKAYGEIVAGARQYSTEQVAERQALTMTATAAASMRYEMDMLNQATRAGLELTPTQRENIRRLAVEMANAETATMTFAASQEEARAAQEAFRGIAQGAVSGLISDLRQGKSAAEAFGNVLNSIADKLIDMAINNLFANAFGGGPGATSGGGGTGGNWLAVAGKVIGSLFGVPAFASGGKVSGPGGGRDDKILARLSNGEFVVNAKATAKNRALLEAVNSNRLPAFADGGMVAPRPLASPRLASSGGGTGQPVNITSTVNVNASGGTPEQNADLARQTQKAVDSQVRAIVQQEMRSNQRASLGRR
ncbi:hypothetical protein U0C82_18785 [Fulvimarina sp. 2208YS6-2-32]|uniref:Uncharacterized protein n=1 Tax=Fulvimarina uroteuthidis TaxID=3098149 RepID=A0ABU5I6Z9_9HYPH|nr:hypothetical protein [Fulvimarina sp. 2208YS6-2-32]MDY8111167.1 hypothetical protein [Fulvimarina sp. 2208YS6-2-32]